MSPVLMIMIGFMLQVLQKKVLLMHHANLIHVIPTIYANEVKVNVQWYLLLHFTIFHIPKLTILETAFNRNILHWKMNHENDFKFRWFLPYWPTCTSCIHFGHENSWPIANCVWDKNQSMESYYRLINNGHLKPVS